MKKSFEKVETLTKAKEQITSFQRFHNLCLLFSTHFFFFFGRVGSSLLRAGFSLVVESGLLTAVASLVVEHGL